MEYLWVGNNPGNKEQIFLTTDSPIYLFTKALPNLMKKVNGDFKTDIGQILNEFFDDGIVDPSKFEFLNEKLDEKMIDKYKNDILKRLKPQGNNACSCGRVPERR